MATSPAALSSSFSTAFAIHPNSLFSFHITDILLLAISFSVCYVAALLLYRVFFSPLSAIPGPWYAAVSDLWITTHTLRMQQCRTVEKLFEQYGPVVRIGPSKVAFRDFSTMRNIYCVQKFDKSSYYKSLLTNNNDHAMTTLPHAEHAMRRKSYATHYIPANLSLFQPELQEFAFKLTNVLERISGKTSVECLDLLRHLMVDVISCTVFGARSGSLDNWAKNIRDPLTVAVYDFPKRGVLRSAVPTWAWNLVCRISNDRWREVCNSDSVIAEFVGARLYETRANLQSCKTGIDGTEKMPLIERMIHHRLVSTHEGLCDQDIISECMGHVIAGVDTTSTTLSYMFWELSRRPDILHRLQAEIDEASSDQGMIPDLQILLRLPYLEAFFKESLRLYTAVPSLLERVVPSRSTGTVAKVDDEADMMGYALPPGTIVATQAWSMHRDASIFPSPDTFLPERWLPVDGSVADQERLTRMTQHLIPFGIGSRHCGGQNFVQSFVRIVVAAVVKGFNVSANSEETNDRTMEMNDAFVLFPASRECKLSFLPRQL